MKNKPLILIAIGLVLIAIGGFMQFSSGAPAADPALVRACEATMSERGADDALIAQCRDVAFATATTATDATSAARATSAANNSEVGGGMLGMLLIGLGLAALVGGVVLRQRRAPV